MGEKDRNRILQFIILFSFLFFVIIARIAQLQFTKGEELRTDSLKRRLYTQELTPSRGEIVDRNGTTIVGNRKCYNAYVVPVEHAEAVEKGKADVDKDAATISKILGVDKNEVKANLLKEKSYYRLIKKDISKDVVEKLKEAKIAGLGIETTTARSYPQKSMLSNVIGFVGKDGNGLEGLEATYDKTLTGKSGLLIVERDRQGNKIPSKQHEYVQAEEGNSITLTIDSKIQQIADEELAKLADSDINPNAAYCIVQDVNTGEILAMSNQPTYDPAKGGNAPAEDRKNGVVQFNYEPGSVFKLVTLASGLESGAINKNTTINDPNGYIQVGNHKIKNWDCKARGTLTIQDAAKYSNNVAMVRIGQKIGKETFYDFVHKFGFGQKTNVGLYGEEKGLVRKVESLSNLDYATNNIGQTIMVTPLQMINAVSAIVNGGNLMQPYIIKDITNNEGKVIESNKPHVIRRVISEENSKTMRELMRYVVTGEGGVSVANIPGFDIGGKTGTAQKTNGSAGYAAGKYVTSFCGVAPTANPKYAVIVIVDEPKGSPVYGSTTAAPTATNILKRILLQNKEVDTNAIKQASKESGDN